MIKLDFKNIEELKQTHYKAIESYVCDIMRKKQLSAFYQAVMALPGFDGLEIEDLTWLERFILADVDTLRMWTSQYPQHLEFDCMRKLYLNRFSSSPDIYVDRANTYNAYTLFRLMDIHVCPYCEHESIEEVSTSGKVRRTVEFDHFFPKGDNHYPGLAMCFYNLIPSCKQCNDLKLVNGLSANPYDKNIESLTCLYPDLPAGVLMDSVSDDQCKINLHATGSMVQNDGALALQQRYESVSPEVRRLLRNKQNFPEEKLEEYERLGIDTKANLIYSLFGNPRAKAKGKELHTKMKEDLIGY